MKIGMVLDRPFPPDHRVDKEARSLIADGHEIHLLSLHHGDKKVFEEIHGINVHRIYFQKNVFKKLSAAINVLPIYNWIWKRFISKKVNTLGLQVLHIHDLPLSKVAMKIRKKYKIPVVIDMHEDYADWIIETPHYSTFIGKIVRNLSKWKKYEKKYLQMSDHVIGVSPILIDKMVKKYELPRDKIAFVPNTPNPDFMKIKKIDEDIKDKLKDKFNLIYVGGISYLRGIQNVLPQIELLKQKIPNIQFVIVGDGTYRKNLEELVDNYNLDQQIIFTGWETIERLSAYIHLSHIGIYPSLRYRGVNDKVPTKMFQYWALKKPVLASDYLLPRQMVNQYKAGFTLDFEIEGHKLVEYVEKLYLDEDLRRRMGENGRRAIDEEWNWENMVKPLLKLYKIKNI